MAKFLKLKKSNCRNCHKCIRHCPVKSIRYSKNQAHIISDECILCGNCFVICPQNAKEIESELNDVRELIKNHKVIVSLAPSFVANYPNISINEMRRAIKELGFYDVEETAIGATIVKNEYNRILKEENRNILISSCCHSINLLIQKYYPHLLKYLANVVSPMQAHSMDIKKRYKDVKTVFIGPCVAKKDEADHYKEIVDAVLTFDELSLLFNEANITLKEGTTPFEKSKARLFPTTGGILKTMDLSNTKYEYMAIDGVNNCIDILKDIENGIIDNCFIEMSACVGSCIGGPVLEKKNSSHLRGFIDINRRSGKLDFEVEQLDNLNKDFVFIERNNKIPNDAEIYKILRQMGKKTEADELNCGSCGYDTCREKAIAIYQGKAEISMCLPYLKDKAESFSECIVSNTPNGLIVVDEDYNIQQINYAARSILNIKYANEVIGEQVVRILDPLPFMEVNNTKRNLHNDKVYLEQYDKYIDQSIIYDNEYHLFICIMRDITKQIKEQNHKENISKQTIEIADKVVDKQMRIVQQIASLLGETAAETKIALTKLKDSIKDE